MPAHNSHSRCWIFRRFQGKSQNLAVNNKNARDEKQEHGQILAIK